VSGWGRGASTLQAFRSLRSFQPFEALDALRPFQALDALRPFQALDALRPFEALRTRRGFGPVGAVDSDPTRRFFGIPRFFCTARLARASDLFEVVAIASCHRTVRQNRFLAPLACRVAFAVGFPSAALAGS
jgi:hypothetical protein